LAVPAICPHCGAPRNEGPECRRCGVIYAKAETRTAPVVEAVPSEWDTADANLETRVRTWAIPVALAGAFLTASIPFARMFMRIFFSMWIHELGHASTAWLCGFPAFPGPWFTPMAAERHPLFAVFVFAVVGAGAVQAWRTGWRSTAFALAGVALLQGLCSTLLSQAAAKQLILFMGDGGCLVLGALLMLTVYSPEGSVLQRGWLRFGFLVIGAAALADAFSLWWSARTDPDLIPFGMNEGRGLSDPSALTDQFGWSADDLVRRYVMLGCACLVGLAAAYGAGLLRGRTGRNRKVELGR
jgi:hypothetical protein